MHPGKGLGHGDDPLLAPLAADAQRAARQVHVGKGQHAVPGRTDAAAGHAVVGQGEIDAILSAHPEDRRELIEQAAGVRKYQLRRAEAVPEWGQIGLFEG